MGWATWNEAPSVPAVCLSASVSFLCFCVFVGIAVFLHLSFILIFEFRKYVEFKYLAPLCLGDRWSQELVLILKDISKEVPTS